MARQGNTTAVGLGYQHQQARQRALAALRDGDFCARCQARGIEHPMTRALITRRPDGRLVAPQLHLDDFPGRAYGGPQVKRLSYRACNVRAGQALAAQLQRGKRRPRRVMYNRWLAVSGYRHATPDTGYAYPSYAYCGKAVQL